MTEIVRARIFIDYMGEPAGDQLDVYLKKRNIGKDDIISCNLAGVGKHTEILLVYRQGSHTEPMNMALFGKKEKEE